MSLTFSIIGRRTFKLAILGTDPYTLDPASGCHRSRRAGRHTGSQSECTRSRLIIPIDLCAKSFYSERIGLNILDHAFPLSLLRSDAGVCGGSPAPYPAG